jgi:hypothetical protein
MYATARGEEFNLAYIGEDFSYPRKTPFDSDYLRHLFQYAFERAAGGKEWRKSLPAEELPATPPPAGITSPNGGP